MTHRSSYHQDEFIDFSSLYPEFDLMYTTVEKSRSPFGEIILFLQKSQRYPIVLIEISYIFLKSDVPLDRNPYFENYAVPIKSPFVINRPYFLHLYQKYRKFR